MTSRLLVVGVALATTACPGGGAGDEGLVAVPSRADFAEVVVGRGVSLQLELENRSAEPIWVASARADVGIASAVEVLQAPSLVEGGSSAPLVVQARPPRSGVWRGDIILRDTMGQLLLLVPVIVHAVEGGVVPSPSEVDFGRLRVGSRTATTVTFTNVVSVPLELSALAFDAGSSPGVQASLARSRTLAPGESVAVEVSVEPRIAGEGSATVRAVLDAAEGPQAPLEVRFEGVSSWLELTPSAVFFSKTRVSEVDERVVVVRNLSFEAVNLSSVGISGPAAFSAAPYDDATVPPGGLRELRVRFAPTRVGALTGALEVTSADGSRGAIRLEGEGVSAVTRSYALDGRLDFGPVEVGAPAVRRIWLDVLGGASSAPEAQFQPGGSGLRLSRPLEVASVGDRVRVDVEWTPERSGAMAAALHVGTASLAVSGRGVDVPAPGLEVWPIRGAFGAVLPERSAVRRFELRSTGTAALTHLSARVSAPFRLLEAPPERLDPGASATVRVGVDGVDLPLADVATGTLELTHAEGAIQTALEAKLRPRTVPDLEVVLRWEAGAEVDVDLHLVGLPGASFDAPWDLSFCHPVAVWDEEGAEGWLQADRAGLVGEERSLVFGPAAGDVFEVEVVNPGPVGAAAEVEVWSDGRSIGLERRRVEAGHRWTAGRASPSVGTWSASEAALSVETRRDCE